MENIDEPRAPVQGEGEGKNAGGDGEDADKRNADSDFDDMVIEVDESELDAELTDESPGRKY
jgi:hypothetical protein